ncbi:ribonuclease HI family protein [Lentilactobacillus senioris]|uniref:ribonuclease HI family protein n=1 Tax=Lentilactobacillus senioris TaxID=931534 RepID=UPI00227EC0EA|nr:ribonuclease HI family protein [Lentilactobacillus senioris]MCY9806852.1 ribonuclease HI family protein [Lentilactobacillus senioris]
MIKLYTDGAYDPHSGLAAVGALIVVDGTQMQFKTKVNATNNHQAEFLAAHFGFNALQELTLPDQPILFYSDSRIVIDSLNKEYSKHYVEELSQLLQLEDQYAVVVNQWIADRQNEGAHRLALQALRKS